MHWDLKPENFLFANKREPAPLKAIDFGLSIFFQPGERFKEIVGSPYYMAPELLRFNYGPEIDICSTGVILYILLSGVSPFWAETEEKIAHAIVRSEVDFEREPWPKVSKNVKDLIRCMLDRNPYCRLTAQEVLDVMHGNRVFSLKCKTSGMMSSLRTGVHPSGLNSTRKSDPKLQCGGHP